MTTILNEFRRGGCYLVSEAGGSQSREVAVITGGAVYQAGTVLGRVTASGKMTILNPAATDGSQNAAGVLFAKTDASAGDVSASYTARLAEVNGLVLTWPMGITVSQQSAAVAQFLALNILVRT